MLHKETYGNALYVTGVVRYTQACFKPTVDDIFADDWEVFDESLRNPFGNVSHEKEV